LFLQQVVDGSNATNLTIVITQTIIINKGISDLDFISKKKGLLVVTGLVYSRVIA
jgi:hypothetical protein